MFRRRRPRPPEYDPLVTDRHGRVIGVRTPPPREPPESAASRRWRRHSGLAATGELQGQATLRNEFSWLHVDPPRC